MQALPALRVPVRLFEGYTPQVFTLLQHGSTVAGLTILGLWGVRWYLNAKAARPVNARPVPTWLKGVVLLTLLLPSIAAGLRVLMPRFKSGERSFELLQQTLGQAVFSAGTVFLMTLLLAALAWRVVGRSSRQWGETSEDYS